MLKISITRPELQKIVEKKLRSGEYRSAEEVVAAALSLLDQPGDEALSPVEMDELRKQVLVGVEQADRGEFVEFTAEEIIERESKALRARRRRNGKRWV